MGKTDKDNPYLNYEKKIRKIKDRVSDRESAVKTRRRIKRALKQEDRGFILDELQPEEDTFED